MTLIDSNKYLVLRICNLVRQCGLFASDLFKESRRLIVTDGNHYVSLQGRTFLQNNKRGCQWVCRLNNKTFFVNRAPIGATINRYFIHKDDYLLYCVEPLGST